MDLFLLYYSLPSFMSLLAMARDKMNECQLVSFEMLHNNETDTFLSAAALGLVFDEANCQWLILQKLHSASGSIIITFLLIAN